MIQVKLKDGDIVEFLKGGFYIFPDGTYVDDSEIDLQDFEINFKAYTVEENKLVKKENYYSIIEERTKNELRLERSKECFPIINRGTLWYNLLSKEQLDELTTWYKDWLDVTNTKIIPERPEWLS